ncbi:hypothetical protein H5410_040617 [Solanum commersonii]|uniref:Uncharacterized protein n=1 Tax=Solanum commersonii TaxID=4109 RepID=A0A9J5XRE4_SOLCO|nr:hypothetical protein H5410_040617 [Solanum commersonii]
MGSIEFTVAYGPVYFNTKPNLQLSLTNSNKLDVLTLNVKTHGYNYAPGSELICLSYRIYFKLLATLNPKCKLYDRLKKDHKSPWTNNLTTLVKNIKQRVQSLPCLTLANPAWQKIVETDVSNIDGPSLGNQGLQSAEGITLEEGADLPQRRGMSLINLHSRGAQKATLSSVHLKDIPEGNPLYAELRAYLSQKEKGDTFASIAKDDHDDIKLYEKVVKKEIIFLLENSEIQRKDEPWKIFQRYLINGLYFPGESYKTCSYYETISISTGSVDFQHFSGYNTSENVYNFSKMIIKQIISIEDWGISSMKERQISLNKVPTNFTYWDYITAFSKVLYYNNERHKHTWFVKVCSKIFDESIPNWFLNWWSYHDPTIKILLDPFLKLYKEWVKVSPNLNKLYYTDHICYMEQIEQLYFFIEFSIPWIHK